MTSRLATVMNIDDAASIDLSLGESGIDRQFNTITIQFSVNRHGGQLIAVRAFQNGLVQGAEKSLRVRGMQATGVDRVVIVVSVSLNQNR